MDAFTPAQTTELVSRIGAKKARMRIDKMFINSFMGGALISFGCALSLSTSASVWFQVRIGGAVLFLFRSVSTGIHHPLLKCFLLRQFSEATTPNTSKKT
jgi:formate/nitrite transporter FocA (FNT family)